MACWSALYGLWNRFRRPYGKAQKQAEEAVNEDSNGDLKRAVGGEIGLEMHHHDPRNAH